MNGTDPRIAKLVALGAKYGIELTISTPEEMAIELYRQVPALAQQRAQRRRDFRPRRRGEPFADIGNESAWDVR